MLRRTHAARRPALVAACFLALGLPAQAAPTSARPAAPAATRPVNAADFPRFVEGLWPEARARGVSRATFDEAFRGVGVDPKIVSLSQKQSEFVRPIWEYLNGAVGGQRLQRGAGIVERLGPVLDEVERAYGVPKSVILGVWGMETNFGSFTGSIYTIQALATLAFTGYRGEFFRGELLTALQILEQDHLNRDQMLGSWAGAMGQTQFMPSSFMKFAVDGDGDGKRDIWTSVPDALASTANYLKLQGWQTGLPWGFEVQLPERFDFRNLRQGFPAWAGLGLRRVDGRPLPRSGEATLFLPAGAKGPAFLVTDNYAVIKTYNSSDAYALAVAHLGDRLVGGPAIQGTWPVNEPQLDRDQRAEVQRRLTSLGFYDGEVDGRLGSKSRDAVRRFQLARNLVADGYATPAVLGALRAAR